MAQVRASMVAAIAAIAAKRRWTAEDAAAVLAAAERSTLTLGAFATRHGLDAQRLYRWRRELGATTSEPAPVAFAEVPVMPAPARPRVERERFEVVLRSGHVVRFGPEFDAGALRRLVAALEEPASC